MALTLTSKSLGRTQCDTDSESEIFHALQTAFRYKAELILSHPHSRAQGNMPPSGPEGDLLGGPVGVGAEGLTPLGGGGGPKPPEDFSGVEQGGVTMDQMESVMEPLQFDYNSQMQMDSAPTVGLFDYTNQQQVTCKDVDEHFLLALFELQLNWL